jgi:AhpD family alkylhydroperoxidase
MKTRGVDWINNFWKALDPLVKEMVYVAVSATNGCEYCTYSHTAAGLRIDVDRQFK